MENAVLFLRSQREHKVRIHVVSRSSPRNIALALARRTNSGRIPGAFQELPGMLTTRCQALLERYNPLFNLTAEEHIKATANRVGLNMPITPDGSNPEGKE